MPQIQSELGAEGEEAGNENTLGNEASNTYNEFSPQANQATEAEAQYLTQNPYSNVTNEAMLNRATAGTTTAYQQARSQLAASLAARGMGSSGQLTGGLADIDAAQANTMGNAQNNLAMGEIAQLGQNMGTRANLLNDAANQGFEGANTAYGNAGRTYGDIASEYGGVGQQQEEDQMQQQEEQNQMLEGVGSGVATAAGGYFSNQAQTQQQNALIAALKQGNVANPLVPGGAPSLIPGQGNAIPLLSPYNPNSFLQNNF